MNHFPKLHIDLQKFAIAFEELVEDETNPKIYKALRATQIAIKTMLCEVEITIMDLPYLQIPSRVERSIMSNTEREPVDETRRLVRDWGILLKYRDYLHAWKHILDYWLAPEETFDNIIRYSNPIAKMSMLLHLWQYSIEKNNTMIATKLIENVRHFSNDDQWRETKSCHNICMVGHYQWIQLW